MIEWTNLQAVLVWLTQLGAPLVAMYVFSLVAENVPAWHTLPKMVKFVAPPIVSILLAVGATLLLQRPDIIQTVAPWWTVIVGSLLAYAASQKGYMDAKSSGYGVKKLPTSKG